MELKRFLIAGGTGRQGGAVVQALLTDTSTHSRPENIFVLTRSATGSSAISLAKQGIQLIEGNLNSPATIFKRFEDASDLGVFLAQAHGPTEIDDAKAFIQAAAESGVRYFVYSSVDRGGQLLSDRDASYCRTFSNKFHIEKFLIETAARSKESGSEGRAMDYTILRPTWFAENTDWGFPGRLCMTGWRDNLGGKQLQVVTAADLGKWAVEALLRPDAAGICNNALTVASELLTYDEMARIFEEETGKPVATSNWLLARLMIWAITDLRTMFGWIDERGYGAEFERLRAVVPPTTFRAWAKTRAIDLTK